jgi:hypothetical protein
MRIWLFSALLALGGCVGDGSAGSQDAAPDTAPIVDASNDVMDATMSDADAGPVPPKYFSFTDPVNWQAFDLTSIAGPVDFFRCATFDGKYLYFGGGQAVIRYDPTMPFDQFGSWSTFSTSDLTTGLNAPSTMIYDGQRYIYMVQYGFGYGTFVRYDTQSAFTSASSWTFYDLKTNVSSAATGFLGGAFDGKYFYLINDNQTPAITYRFDTKSPAFFTSPSGYEQFDLGTVFPTDRVGIHVGGAFDGRYVYSVPAGLLSANQAPDLFVRYDTTQPFAGDGGAWQSFDGANLAMPPKGPGGAIFDGTYLYFPPSRTDQTPVVATRYDTTKAFGDVSSWATIDLKTVDPNVTSFVGGTWDGRYVYMTPLGSVAARYDTTQPFTTTASWETFDTSGKVPGPSNTGAQFSGSAFDGAYVYFVTYTLNARTVLRFHARAPTKVPSVGGSFL